MSSRAKLTFVSRRRALRANCCFRWNKRLEDEFGKRKVSAATLVKFNDRLGGHRILIVEDELIIAWELQDIVEALGGSVLGPIPSVPAALRLLGQQRPDAALLDVNLQGQKVTPVAIECQRRNIPFAIVTAYGGLCLNEPVLESAPRVWKPVNLHDIAVALSAIIEFS